MIEIMIDLQGGAKAPLYEKIYKYIKDEIVDGKISKGEKLPSTRLLAKHLMVSRSTVEMAYDQLFAEGYIEAEPCRGYFACNVEDLYKLEQKETKSRQSGDATKKEKKYEVDFSPYAIDTKNFPFNVWRKLHKNVLLDDREELLLSGDGKGDYGLRTVIADYLHQARGVECNPNQIVIGAGNEYLEILLAQVIGKEKKVLMEDPTYLQAYRTFRNIGYEVKNVLTEDGNLSIDAVRKENPDIIYIMPSHQFPLGTVMPLKQRIELLKWASEQENRYLIEDDHDSEFRYRGKPIPSLQSVDREEKVIYLGTFSKSIAPSLRISYMVLPEHLKKRYEETCGFYSTTVPKIQQEVLREFIKDGYFGRHLNKMRGIYKGKHDFVVSELKKRTWVENITGDNAGLHVLVWVKTKKSEKDLCKEAELAGVHITGIQEHYISDVRKEQPVLLLGYGKLEEAEIQKGLQVLDCILKEKTTKNIGN